ncbi:MAG: phosphoserine phosphatase SerB [Spirochaetaceae bacterium]|nr:phosphoserine phosphatase SerB [Spirochaetaceae bacterium]
MSDSSIAGPIPSHEPVHNKLQEATRSGLLLINISGVDRPGITRSITEVLSAYNVQILDMGQSVIHESLSLGILIRIPPEQQGAPVLKDLLFRAHDFGIPINFTPVDQKSYDRWVMHGGLPRYIVTLLSRDLRARHVHQVTRIIADQGLNINSIRRLSRRIPGDELADLDRSVEPEKPVEGSQRRPPVCLEFQVSGNDVDFARLKETLLSATQQLGVDIAFQKDDLFRRNRRLIAFDMDSTLIQAEVIDELAKEAGVGEEVSKITESAMRGEIDFNESFRRRVGLLKGMSTEFLEGIYERLPVTEGAPHLIKVLKSMGYKTVILSGGFTFFGERLRKRLGMDYIFANELVIRDGHVTGEVQEPIVNGERKAELLGEIAEKEGVRKEQVIAVGDGANDLPMLGMAGLGIAFRAKPVVRKEADQAISNLGLDAILYLLGYRHEDFPDEL